MSPRTALLVFCFVFATIGVANSSMVVRRQAYLDELETRNRAGFARWPAGGARAGEDPQRFPTAGG
jgi:hypothetical protein